ncbi:hypothetical protein [Halalkaliarchaeum sp. AArc-CO]|nr:hypothetical protein [Halalkaliarchaeum sp. AArc-CO]
MRREQFGHRDVVLAADHVEGFLLSRPSEGRLSPALEKSRTERLSHIPTK